MKINKTMQLVLLLTSLTRTSGVGWCSCLRPQSGSSASGSGSAAGPETVGVASELQAPSQQVLSTPTQQVLGDGALNDAGSVISLQDISVYEEEVPNTEAHSQVVNPVQQVTIIQTLGGENVDAKGRFLPELRLFVDPQGVCWDLLNGTNPIDTQDEFDNAVLNEMPMTGIRSAKIITSFAKVDKCAKIMSVANSETWDAIVEVLNRAKLRFDTSGEVLQFTRETDRVIRCRQLAGWAHVFVDQYTGRIITTLANNANLVLTKSRSGYSLQRTSNNWVKVNDKYEGAEASVAYALPGYLDEAIKQLLRPAR